jgi:hypothetical protein
MAIETNIYLSLRKAIIYSRRRPTMKKKIIRRFRVRGISREGSGGWYEVGIYYALDEQDAIENCKRLNPPFLLRGLKLEAYELAN